MKSEEPIDHLNSFLRSRDVSPFRYTLKTPWNDASGRTRRLHERKAKQAVSAVLGEIAPNDPDLLWESIMSSKQNETGNHTCSSGLDKELMYTLANCHKNANERDSRRQILSIMADKVILATIQQWIPGLTSYRFKVARQHAAFHGSGKLVPTNAQTKSFIPEAKLAHFLDFIISSHVIQDLPFRAKTITLSTNEVIQVTNVVRNMIPERIVCQYQKYSAEHDFTPMSRSTLLRILHICSASTRLGLVIARVRLRKLFWCAGIWRSCERCAPARGKRNGSYMGKNTKGSFKGGKAVPQDWFQGKIRKWKGK